MNSLQKTISKVLLVFILILFFPTNHCLAEMSEDEFKVDDIISVTGDYFRLSGWNLQT